MPPGEQKITLFHGLSNPVSIAKAGTITVRTLLRRTGETLWSYIDEAVHESKYSARRGSIAEGQIVVKAPGVGATVSAEQVLDRTYVPNQLLDFEFTPTHSVPRGGFLKVRYPPGTFTFNAAATAVAQFAVVHADSTSSVATIQRVINTDEEDDLCKPAKSGCVIGLVSDEKGLEKGKSYAVRVAGLRNPRHVVDYGAMEKN